MIDTFPELNPMAMADRAGPILDDLLAEVIRIMELARRHKADPRQAIPYLELIDQLHGDLRMAGLTIGLLSPWMERDPSALGSPEVELLIQSPETLPRDPEEIRQLLARLPESDRQELFRALETHRPFAVKEWREISAVTSYRPESAAYRFPRIEEGVKFLAERRIVTEGEWSRLAQAERIRSVYMPGTSQQQLQKLRDSLQQSFREGEGLADFRKRLDEDLKARKWEVETAFRTATKQAYLDGVSTVIESPAGKRFPYVKYVATVDNRTRQSHAVMDGKVIAVGTPEYAAAKALQAEYNCRCTFIPLTAKRAESMLPP